ncbi:MAG: glycoside hydrolase family 3 C-terminal domain-containing protein [Gammaproteobacteria bacterium]|nr:glycoside hydrolase family 3 C-terminal domain-containing protein [Gammaproteobacteria bacterium]
MAASSAGAARVAGETPTADYPAPAEALGAWASSVLESMTLEEKAGQLLMPWMLGDFAPAGSEDFERMAEAVRDDGVGGVIVSLGTPSEVAAKINNLQSLAKYPLLVGADLESGAGYRMRGAVYLPNNIELGGATLFPSLMAVGAAGDDSLAWEMGRITAVEARAVGVHLPFAPVLDVNNNPDNPVIATRSFGEDPAEVARLGSAFVRGLQAHGAIATGKHFPGHGDTGVDSHVALPVIRVDRERLDRVELRPFRAAVDAGMGAVMSAHVSIPSVTGSVSMPSTLSPAVLSDLLRGEMGFEGLIVTDAMNMAAITRRFGARDAVVRALEAGADIILMPEDPREARESLVAAVRSGRVSEARLDRSVARILELKERMGLDRERYTDIFGIHRKVGIPEHVERATEIAEASITLLRNRRNLLSLRGTRTANVLSVTYRARNNLLAGRYFNDRVRETYRRLSTAYLDSGVADSEYDRLLSRGSRSDLVIVSAYVAAARTDGRPNLPEALSDFVETLAERRVPHIVISFGNPYLLSDVPEAQAYMLAWSASEVSQIAAARALFGEIPIRGRTPTGLPSLFDIGDGIQLPVRGR